MEHDFNYATSQGLLPEGLLPLSNNDFPHMTDEIADGSIQRKAEKSKEGTPTNSLDTKGGLNYRSLMKERASLGLASVSLVGLVVLLQNYSDQPSPKWTLGPWGITLNAIISIVSTVFRASILMPVASCVSQFCWIWFSRRQRPLRDICYFDAASRGPFGSIRLLFRLRFMQFASLGAIITILALGLDPVFQLVVRYETRSVVDANGEARAVASYTYHTGLPTADTEISGAFYKFSRGSNTPVRTGK